MFDAVRGFKEAMPSCDDHHADHKFNHGPVQYFLIGALKKNFFIQFFGNNGIKVVHKQVNKTNN